MKSNTYRFVTRWRVESTVEEISEILGNASDLPRWWPSVYLEVQELAPGDADGIGKVVSLYTKGWLPYTLRLLDHLGVRQACLVGLSKGGGVALDFALTYPERTLSLALIDTILGGFAWSTAGSGRDALVWQEAARGGVPAARQSWLTHPLFAPAMRQPAVATRLRQIIADYSGWHFVNADPEQGIDPPAAQRLAELKVPVLAIVGEFDTPDFRQITALVGRQVPQVRTFIVSDAGHMANMEAPEQVTQSLLDFLEVSTK